MDKKLLKTGTTTVGLVCKDGIVLAADRRASAGYMVADKKSRKVIIINDDIAITTAGLVSDIQLLTKIIKAQLKLIEIRRAKKTTVKQAANLLGGLVYSNIRRMSMVPGIVGFILGGRDLSGFHLYNLGVDGSITEVEDYAADGSGMQFATGVLESLYKKDMTVNDGIKLAVTAINTAIQRDIATGNGIDVVTITKDGAKVVLEKEINARITM
ncbi:MAG: proteasome subunit beta [Candidatus Nanoarchaeia archaeon]